MKLPAGIKLVSTLSRGYTVLHQGVAIGSVYQRDRSYNIHPKAFTLRWWEVKLTNSPRPLSFDSDQLAPPHPQGNQPSHFETRAAAIDALLRAAS